MSLRIGTWNTAGGFGNEATAESLFAHTRQLDADVLVIPEAFSPDGPFLAEAAFEAEGYRSMAIDRDPHDDRSGRMLLMLSRIDYAGGFIPLGERFGLHMFLPSSELSIVGVHLDDRSEAARQASVADYLDATGVFSEQRLLVGDLNAMHRDDAVAKLLRRSVLKRAVELVPSDRGRDVADRLIGMADGGTIELLESNGLQDADGQWRKTFTPGGLPIAQLDHIFHGPSVHIQDFEVFDRGDSDHKPIVATIEV